MEGKYVREILLVVVLSVTDWDSDAGLNRKVIPYELCGSVEDPLPVLWILI